jgi:murein DD-endopeptidase MepM/ murein hydrolase activator NlpD
MALRRSVRFARVTQQFGPADAVVASLEPAMYHLGESAYWQDYPGAHKHAHFHPGIDRAAATGTAVLAMEKGKVLFAGWKDDISGNQVEIEIRPGTQYSVNHLNRIFVRKGQQVARAQRIATVGSTGLATGPHVHEGVSIQDAAGRSILWNPNIFFKGGSRANDPHIRPLP